ncbi:GNAT family N-acetyltransferase [uncultured Wocania sp.]|uniref:GNAT family N-acetyltransferase n=1 Tax=uncultured Wocania sp. TaxID=2834404 RepID=UPI0030FACBE2
MSEHNSISDVTFIGSGISTSFSLLNFLDHINKDFTINKAVSINIIEKYSEFNLGIPYGTRSGFSTLLITSLRNFLVEPELGEFIKWLNKNKSWLLEEFENEGGELSKKWLLDNEDDIKNNQWEDLFIPRRFFGCYINLKVNNKIKELTEKRLINVTHITGEVVDINQDDSVYEITLGDGLKITSKKAILSVGSLPVKHLWQNKDIIEDENLIFINNPYKPNLGVTLNKINTFIANRAEKQTNILIVGANASALELTYKINDFSNKKYSNTNFTFLSSQGLIPDGLIDVEKQKQYTPYHLNELKKEKKLTAKLIAEATFKDLDLADEINLGAASTVDIVSKHFGKLLENLNKKELEIFACDYGNDIGKRQRCAGLHYLNVITNLENQNRFEHLAGRFNNMQHNTNDHYNLEYLDTLTKTKTIHNKPFHIVVNCVGSRNLTENNIPPLFKNLIKKKYCIPNKSKIGFYVNDNLESTKNLHVIGPMLAGNVIENKAVWHVEHCGRIIWISKILAKVLFDDLNKDKKEELKNYKLEVTNLDNDSDIETYNNLLKTNWNNNIYYAYSHLKYFQNETDSLKYFLFKINDSSKILMPLIFRELTLNNENTKYYDVITPYGYSGPLYNDNIDEEHLHAFWKAVDNWYKKNNVVTEFIRFSLTKNHKGYSGHLIKSLLNVKGLLCTNFEDQWTSFSSKVRNNYRKAVSFNLTCNIFKGNEISKDIIKLFFDIYTKTMVRRNAKGIYFFSLNYFENLILNNLNEFSIAFAYIDDIPISAELIIKNNNTIFAFLGGTDSNYFHYRPNDYLRVEIIKWAIKENLESYVLGGGLKDGDGLYKSKKYLFPKNEDIPFCTGRKIINQKIYNKIINGLDVEYTNVSNLIQNADSFFPIYRLNDGNESLDSISFDVITSKIDWKKALDQVENFDFYHTYDYHHLAKEDNYKAVLLRYTEGDSLICFPLIIREIEGTDFYDATSVYGYSGPLHKNIDSKFDNSNFRKAINSFFTQEKIISVFSRLNPFINHQDIILNKIGETAVLGNVVNIDLTKPIEEQRTVFSKTTKRYLNKGRKILDLKISDKKEDLEEFINLYYENMNRVNAAKKYYFSKDYFYKFLNSEDFKTDMLYAIDKETNSIISGAMMIKTNSIIQYHLSGTKNSFLNLSPLRLLIDEMRIQGSKDNYKCFNLGGGLGNNDDELFRFKSSFSKNFKPFKIWRHIVDQAIYNKLVDEKAADLNSNFFPLYRDKSI